MVYALLELASLVVFAIILKRIVGFSPLQQLAFVLETQAEKLQTKLTVTFLYAMQISLVHLGADFSFKFGWLHKYKPNS
ncbi:hypothetical protein PR001_g11438 [Phytophthora rubi]|nr:hypothetical protein PR001_g11438 [Phytophthora rubi]